MRLGILPFGNGSGFGQELADTLAADGIDIVAAESPVVTADDTRREASRLHRADCDGILFWLGGAVPAERLIEACLHLAERPILVAGGYAAEVDTAVAVLENLRFPSLQRTAGDGPPMPSFVKDWLQENRREARQRGFEAVRKLYGQRFFAEAGDADPLEWARRFGTVVLPGADGADFTAASGTDALAALTRHLLELVAGDGAAVVEAKIGDGDTTSKESIPASLARIYARPSGGYGCLISRGELAGDTFIADSSSETAPALIAPGPFYAVAGISTGTLRAVCEALDIRPLLLEQAAASDEDRGSSYSS